MGGVRGVRAPVSSHAGPRLHRQHRHREAQGRAGAGSHRRAAPTGVRRVAVRRSVRSPTPPRDHMDLGRRRGRRSARGGRHRCRGRRRIRSTDPQPHHESPGARQGANQGWARPQVQADRAAKGPVRHGAGRSGVGDSRCASEGQGDIPWHRSATHRGAADAGRQLHVRVGSHGTGGRGPHRDGRPSGAVSGSPCR